MKVGILALQGAFREHVRQLEKLEVETVLVKSSGDLDTIDRLILPGGESTAMGKLIDSFNMKSKLKEVIGKGLPTWGTCAGMILLAKDIGEEPAHLMAMDIRVKRNGYGRQLGSFETQGLFNGKPIPMSFIRAPYIETVGPNVEILARVDEKIVAARQGNILVTSFHPEVTEDTGVLSYFLTI